MVLCPLPYYVTSTSYTVLNGGLPRTIAIISLLDTITIRLTGESEKKSLRVEASDAPRDRPLPPTTLRQSNKRTEPEPEPE